MSIIKIEIVLRKQSHTDVPTDWRKEIHISIFGIPVYKRIIKD